MLIYDFQSAEDFSQKVCMSFPLCCICCLCGLMDSIVAFQYLNGLFVQSWCRLYQWYGMLYERVIISLMILQVNGSRFFTFSFVIELPWTVEDWLLMNSVLVFQHTCGKCWNNTVLFCRLVFTFLFWSYYQLLLAYNRQEECRSFTQRLLLGWGVICICP